MADSSSFTGKFRAHRPSPRDSASSSNRISKRAVRSCTNCQKSKLRCDHSQPCQSCVKREESHTCSYYQQSSPPRGRDAGRNVAAEERLLHLESMVKQLMESQTASPPAVAPSSDLPTPPEQSPPHVSVDRGPGELVNGVRYIGHTHWSAILDDIKGLKEAVLTDPVNAYEPDESIAGFNGELIFGSATDYNIHDLISQLPSDIEMDRYLSIYFRGETFILPIVHTYHFQRQYREFLADPWNVNPLWLSMLFSICYMASKIGEAMGSSSRVSQTDPSSGRARMHKAAACCLVLGEYRRPQQFTVEALLLYAQCKNLSSLDPSREAGAILSIAIRLAYELGYHRDPDSVGHFTVFEGEMRRRVWAICKQMDLMISFQLGLPSNIYSLETSDTRSPSNLLDADFDTDSLVLPPSRSEEEATSLLWFIVKDREMVGFSKVCQDTLSIKEKTPQEITTLDREIWDIFATVPAVLRARPFSESIGDQPFLIMTRIYIEFIHLKSLCILHRRYMARGNTFSTQACVEAGRRIVSRFIDMNNEFVPGGTLYTERWMLSNFTMNDYLLGIMVLCYGIHGLRKGDILGNITIGGVSATEAISLLKQSHAICVEKPIDSKDAERVARVIALTLNGAGATAGIATDSQSLVQQPRGDESSGLDLQAGGHHTDTLMDPTLLPQLSSPISMYGSQSPFDPFEFISHDAENIDWTTFIS